MLWAQNKFYEAIIDLICRLMWIFDCMEYHLGWHRRHPASFSHGYPKILNCRGNIILFYGPRCLYWSDMEGSSKLFPVFLLNSSIPSNLQRESLHSLRTGRLQHKQTTCAPRQAWFEADILAFVLPVRPWTWLMTVHWRSKKKKHCARCRSCFSDRHHPSRRHAARIDSGPHTLHAGPLALDADAGPARWMLGRACLAARAGCRWRAECAAFRTARARCLSWTARAACRAAHAACRAARCMPMLGCARCMQGPARAACRAPRCMPMLGGPRAACQCWANAGLHANAVHNDNNVIYNVVLLHCYNVRFCLSLLQYDNVVLALLSSLFIVVVHCSL